MIERLEAIEKRSFELEHMLADATLIQDKAQYQKLAKEFSDLQEAVKKYSQYKALSHELAELESMLKEKASDAEFLALAKDEVLHLKEKIASLEKELAQGLKGEDKDENKNVIVEIRAGTGGEEASIFAGDLFKMYSKYAENHKWQIEVMSGHSTEVGGFKEVIFSVRGKGAYRRLKYESGVHRVQRVPATEAQGRIHTSTATVAVMKEAEEIDLVIDPKDLKIDVFRSSGPGGQSVNTTDSAVRITHIPTATVVVCQDERSQLKNKNKALRVLRTRISDKMQQEELAKQSQERKAQIGTGDRSEKIRTYNFPDRRITDHRVGVTVYQLEKVFEGEIDEFVDALLAAEEKRIREAHTV
ncbi:MAG: peptide chain release factor 1 [Omnitrophica WOR_2 bacterium GWF2_43_52]|nr:MAG: peptide chain release factor 1 [Omnitrophica WOR_2 bacterium GWA2_37_7]OGX15102.1 MAG: peptide chain release factor 1 [Omnitrophica WOR_2 bacterium GWC2_44_8]OGX21743.1 MAG: peptide chain release factor 1 [Omnitrophica WOR_2 bacterium GWF2_43_52]OGX54786.1 MAG: peptide chain release factor 1 [Omnitrophica WOR_2 bacterium RIFOXYC2_FULL_43_9]HAH21890.1 peptide chain release factor 1 [Candidatus Omnitrophota bacterium]